MAYEDYRPISEFRKAGLLWALNRFILHPRGYAVSFAYDDETEEVAGWKLLGDGTECWAFDEETDDAGFAKFNALLKGEGNGC